MKKVFLALIAVLGFAAYSIAADGYSPGSSVTDFKLKNIDGKPVSLSDYPAAKGFIITFTCNHCPYAKAYEDRIIALNKKYANKGYAEFKLDLGMLVADKLGALQESFKSIRADESKLMQIIEEGNAQASTIARKKLDEVKEKIGLL